MGAMQRLDGLCRRAMQSFRMIENDDAVCVAVSGGKDSVALVLALQRLAAYYEKRYTLQALTIDPRFGGVDTDYSALTAFFAERGIPHTVRRSNIGPLIFDDRQEHNPCALCAKMRRGALHSGAQALGCNKVALGHHLDDAVETFYMNLFGEGRIGCFSPVTWLSRRQLTVIRPLVYATEQEVANAAREAAAPLVKSRCPVDGETNRSATKRFVQERCQLDPAFRQKTLGALQKAAIDGWQPPAPGRHRPGSL